MAEGAGNSLVYEQSRISAALSDRNDQWVYPIGVPRSTVPKFCSLLWGVNRIDHYRVTLCPERARLNSRSPPTPRVGFGAASGCYLPQVVVRGCANRRHFPGSPELR